MLNRLQDVFESFQKHQVKYLIIGGITAVLHGVPRATFDLDILIEATPDNAQRLLDALLHEITVFSDRVRMDVQTVTPGIRFEEAWQNRETMEYQDKTVMVNRILHCPECRSSRSLRRIETK